MVLNGCVPLVMMLLDAKSHRLGVDPIRASLHITGSLAIGTLLLTLAVTPIRVLTGWKKAILYRRPLGLMAFVYAMAHVSIFAVHDQQWDLLAIKDELLQRRYLQIGLASLLLMLPLALTSTPAMIDRLGLSRWKKLHRLIYPASILAVIHYAMQTKADPYWRFGYIVLIVALLGWRLWDRFSERTTAKPRGKPANEHGSDREMVSESLENCYRLSWFNKLFCLVLSSRIFVRRQISEERCE